MTWRSERGSNDYDCQQGVNPFDDVMQDQSMRDKADLSSAIWKRDSGCGGGGCSCGCCHGRGGNERPVIEDPKAFEAGISKMTKVLQGLGLTIDLPALWPKLYEGTPYANMLPDLETNLNNSGSFEPNGKNSGNHEPNWNDSVNFEPNGKNSGNSDSPYSTDSSDRTKTITVSNGDQLTLGGMHGFSLVDKDGMPVTVVKTLDSGAMDAPVEHVLSNGAIYRSRGGWNHNESITWPNGDVVRFSDAGKFESYEPHD